MKTTEQTKFIILTGIKHSGKSSLGKILAEKINYKFIDLDDVIEEISNLSCRSLYNQKGKAGFQAVELEACQKIYNNLYINTPVNTVIATGGGICNNPQAFKILKSFGIVIYLKVPEDISCNRIIEASEKRGSYPPYIVQALQDNETSAENVCKIFHPYYNEITAKYEQLADIIVPLTNDTKQKNAQRLLDAL
jgi:shikimate kinase